MSPPPASRPPSLSAVRAVGRPPAFPPLSPHLHTHVVVPNLGLGRGRWSALDGRGLYAHRAVADALYHAHLRVELTGRLGVAWGDAVRGRADVAGVGPEVRAAFSRRAAAIADHLAGLGHDGSGGPTGRAAGLRAAAVAAAVTRPARDPGLDVASLRREWQARAGAMGFGPARLAALLDRSPTPDPALIADAAPAVAASLVRSARPAARRHVVEAWANELGRGARVGEVEAAADRLLGTCGLRRGGGTVEPGVTETRFDPESFAPGLDAPGRGGAIAAPRDAAPDGRAEGRELDRLLARRGMTPPASIRRGAGRARDDPGLDLGR